MDSPPPYKPKRNNTVVIVLIALALAALCCCGVVFGGAFWGMKKFGPLATCGMSMEAMHDAIIAFANDNGGKLPTASTWQDQVKPYYSKELAKQQNKENPFSLVGADADWGCEADDGVLTGIAFNSDLSGKKLDDLQNKSDLVLLFEARERKKNLNMKYDLKKMGTLPKRLGKEAVFVATVDGSTKLVRADGKEADLNFRAGR